MTRAAEIVAALNARSGARALVERSTGLPYGWALWIKSLPKLPPRPHARAGEIEALLALRGPPAPAKGEELGRMQAFLALFRQSWWPAPREERALRWGSRLATLILHMAFLAMLAWMAWMQSLLPPPPPEAGGGGERIGIGFIGRGDPGTPAGEPGQEEASPARTEGTEAAADPQAAGQAAAPAPDEAAAEAQTELALPVPAPFAAEVPAPAVALPPPLEARVLEREVPQPAEPPPVEQPVQVTEVEQPTIDYVLPPPTPRQVQPRPPLEARVMEREVAVVQAPAVAVPRMREIDLAMPAPAEPQLRQREVDEPLPALQRPVATARGPQVDARLPRAPEASVRQREIAMPSPAPAPASASAPAPAASAAAASPAAAANTVGTAANTAGTADAPGNPAAGRPAARTGAPARTASPADSGSGWERALAGDDWGQPGDGQTRPGGTSPGLFDGQGRVRLPGQGQGEGPGQGPGQGPGTGPGEGLAERGAPGGENDSWTRERFEQSGAWLQRPPGDYEGTRFDRYWVPNESLLAEWVRKGIKSVAIPIPGGNGRKLNCVVSLLQLGGGCGVSNDNMNEQPALARPPPDIPFKPELQEDNGSASPL